MAGKPPPSSKAADQAAAAIKRRYGMSGWGTTSAGGVYDVVRESPIVARYGAAASRRASALIAAQLRAGSGTRSASRKKK